MLPGLAPNHTRGSFGSESRLYVENFAPDPEAFIKVEDTGLWLLPAVVAERDRRTGEVKMAASADQQLQSGVEYEADRSIKGSRILGRTAITANGCMVNGLRHQDPYEWAMRFAERELGTFSIDGIEDMPYLRICDEDDCYNSRHFDFDFGRPNLQERRMEANPLWYKTQPSGRIKTIWGDTLPSIEESLQAYIEFQKRNYPFVPIEKSRLTPSGVAHVRFQPVTGCWESWTYYCRPTDLPNKWQFDGYGRLYQKYTVEKFDEQTGEVVSAKRRGHWLAHRVIWNESGRPLKEGRVLNHLCSYRRCCNPLHIEQVSLSENSIHGRKAQSAIQQLEAADPSTKGYYLRPKELVVISKGVLDLYKEAA